MALLCREILPDDGSGMCSPSDMLERLQQRPCACKAEAAPCGSAASRSRISQNQLTDLVTEGTVYIDCWLTISDIEKLLKQNSEKAIYSEYQN